MRMAITGVTGDIGRGYLESLSIDNDIKVLLRDEAVIQREDVTFYRFTDGFNYKRDLLEDFVKGDVVIHCAALRKSNRHTLKEMIAVNAMLTGALTMAAISTNTAKIIYISTEMVYRLSDIKALHKLGARFVRFCQSVFAIDQDSYDLRVLAGTFIEQNRDFDFQQYDAYSLAKYLGEVVVGSMEHSVILRISNAYGPGYSNPRLIPRMIVGRLTGHEVRYIDEEKDFVYSVDINTLIDKVVKQNLSGVIDCRSNESIRTKDIAHMVISATPTAYGSLVSRPHVGRRLPRDVPPCVQTNLTNIIEPTTFKEGFIATMRWHKERSYHQMRDKRSLRDFIDADEHIVKELKGSSAAHLCIVADGNGNRKVRKVAIYDGVEGNGIAKVANEINYYRHIVKKRPKLAAMYPRLLDATIGTTFSSETIEYLNGRNFYQSMKDGDLSRSAYLASFVRFIEKLSECALGDCVPSQDPEGMLDAYYVERSLSRLHSIEDILPVKDTLMINGKLCIAPHILLSDLLTNQQLRILIKPHVECFCFHGDLTLLNTILIKKSQEIMLIDPRGHIGNWDPLYDFGKLHFSLCGFGELVVNKEPIVKENTKDQYYIHFGRIPTISRQLDNMFLGILARNRMFKTKIITQEPYWRHRIAFAKSTHFLADIPFRLYTDGTHETALASYIIGTYYLNKVYEDMENEVTCRRGTL